MAHSSSIHARYGDWLVGDLKAAIECIPDPLLRSQKLAHGEATNPLAKTAK
jgi:hypothetical protein